MSSALDGFVIRYLLFCYLEFNLQLKGLEVNRKTENCASLDRATKPE